MDPVTANLIVIAVLMILSIAAAALLRYAGAPGSAVIGGALAGILIGPTLFGRIAPPTYEHLFIGGVEQREQLQQLRARHHADLLAAREVGADAQAIERIRQEHDAELPHYQRALDEARWEHQRPMRMFVAAVVGLVLLLGGIMRIAPDDAPQSWGSAISVGVWAAALPGALAFLAMRWWWEHDLHSSALVAAAVAIGPWVLTSVDRNAADFAELGGSWMVQTAGRVATIIALCVAGWALWFAHGFEHLMWASVLFALPVGWIACHIAPTLAGLGVSKPEGDGSSDGYPGQGRGYMAAQNVLLPVLAACAAVRIEVIEHFAFWPLLVLLLLSGDGRWLGAVTGSLLLGGRSGLRTMRLVLGSMACGPTQLAVLVIALHLWALPDELPLALLIGALVIDATTPARRKIARDLAEVETEWSNIDQP